MHDRIDPFGIVGVAGGGVVTLLAAVAESPWWVTLALGLLAIMSPLINQTCTRMIVAWAARDPRHVRKLKDSLAAAQATIDQLRAEIADQPPKWRDPE